jgi:eukaryotic-like serine/threonine-protein kinase
MIHAVEEQAGWGFGEGAEIAPGRSVLKALGGGSRYEVLLVWDDRLFAITVAKVLRPAFVEDERALRELSEEADALATLAHPVLVRGFDAVLDGPHPHVLIEHLEGPTLRRLIRRGGALPLEQLLPLAAHVAAALHYMAEEGWVHLDTKPDNIVMGVPPRLIDLSIAQPVERATALRSPIGTDPYMSPEQCAPSEHLGMVGPPADVWGLGATLYHAVAGRRPFPSDPDVRFPQLERRPVELPGSVPPALRELISAMLAGDPAARPTAAEVATRLQPLVAETARRISFSRRGS